MAFVRVKKIKGKEYAYLVENRWKNKSSRQKVTGYLGRVVRLVLEQETDFFSRYAIDDKEQFLKSVSKHELLRKIVQNELSNHGFSDGEDAQMRWNDVVVDLNARTVGRNKTKVTLGMREGFLADMTLKLLLDFNETGSQAELSLKLAKAFVEAGIKVDEELFVSVYEKLLVN